MIRRCKITIHSNKFFFGLVGCFFFLLDGFSEAFGSDTDILVFRPYARANYEAPLVIDEEVQGFCRQQSLLTSRDDAWRCMTDNKQYDPCFARRFGSKQDVICVQSPWITRGIKIKLEHSLDNNLHQDLDVSKDYPWALELSDGVKCVAIQTHEKFDGLPIRYQCETKTQLFGKIQRCEAQWSILQRDEQDVSTVYIEKAWF